MTVVYHIFYLCVLPSPFDMFPAPLPRPSRKSTFVMPRVIPIFVRHGLYASKLDERRKMMFHAHHFVERVQCEFGRDTDNVWLCLTWILSVLVFLAWYWLSFSVFSILSDALHKSRDPVPHYSGHIYGKIFGLRDVRKLFTVHIYKGGSGSLLRPGDDLSNAIRIP